MYKMLTSINRVSWTAMLALALFGVGDADAGKYTTSKSPMWRVGQQNNALSDACQRGNFNQVKIQNLRIGYNGEIGRGITGIAMKDWNLLDPKGLAEVNVTYHFFNDGYSNCRVYVARLTPRRN